MMHIMRDMDNIYNTVDWYEMYSVATEHQLLTGMLSYIILQQVFPFKYTHSVVNFVHN